MWTWTQVDAVRGEPDAKVADGAPGSSDVGARGGWCEGLFDASFLGAVVAAAVAAVVVTVAGVWIDLVTSERPWVLIAAPLLGGALAGGRLLAGARRGCRGEGR